MRPELDPKEHRRILEKYGTEIKESDYEREVEEEMKEEEKAGETTKFDKRDIFHEMKERQNYNISQLTSSQLKKGTGLWFIRKFSERLMPFIISSIEEYMKLFIDEEADSKYQQLCYKKFLTGFLNLYLEAQKEILTKHHLAVNYVTSCL